MHFIGAIMRLKGALIENPNFARWRPASLTRQNAGWRLRFMPAGIKTAVTRKQSLFYNRATGVFDGQDRRRCDEDGERE
jgi:hypothetical protein